MITNPKTHTIIFRRAQTEEIDRIHSIILQARERLRVSGYDQWQGIYPAREDIQNDLLHGNGYLLTVDDEPAVYGALIFDPEPAYASIRGSWSANSAYGTIHRLAVAQHKLRQGWAKRFMQEAETLTRQQGVCSMRVDTHANNQEMQALLKTLHYKYCGDVTYPHGERLAFDKILF